MMNAVNQSWEERVAALWRDATTLPGDALVRRADALADELDPGDPRASFERACACDTGGFEADAEQHYSSALASGRLDGYRSARATIQLASTLRILGRLDESERLLVAELDRHLEPGHDRALHDEARVTLPLTYVAQGRAVEAADLALSALAPRLSRYNRSVAANAAELVAQTWR